MGTPTFHPKKSCGITLGEDVGDILQPQVWVLVQWKKLVKEEESAFSFEPSVVIKVSSSSLKIYKRLHARMAKYYFTLIPVRWVIDVMYGVSAGASSSWCFISIHGQVNHGDSLLRLLSSLISERHHLNILLGHFWVISLTAVWREHLFVIRLGLCFSHFYVPVLILQVVSSLSGTLLLILLWVRLPEVVSSYLSRKLLFSLKCLIVDSILMTFLSSHLVAVFSLFLSVDTLGHSCFSWLCITLISKIPGHCMVVPIRDVLKLESKA